MGPREHSFAVSLSFQRQCSLPRQSTLVLQEGVHLFVFVLQVPPQGQCESA